MSCVRWLQRRYARRNFADSHVKAMVPSVTLHVRQITSTFRLTTLMSVRKLKSNRFWLKLSVTSTFHSMKENASSTSGYCKWCRILSSKPYLRWLPCFWNLQLDRFGLLNGSESDSCHGTCLHALNHLICYGDHWPNLKLKEFSCFPIGRHEESPAGLFHPKLWLIRQRLKSGQLHGC